MSEKARSPEIGCRWECSKGKQGCPQCAALHGQEFYKNPAPGQQSTADLPQPPLHPNCRCKVMPIIDPAFYVDNAVVVERKPEEQAPAEDQTSASKYRPILSEADVQNGVVIPLLGACGTGDRSVLDGPGYGLFFGKNWAAGQNVTTMTPEETRDEINKVKAVDKMDALGKQHDLDYVNCEIDCKQAHEGFIARYDCEFKGKMLKDEELVRGLEALPEDPTQWGNDYPWTPERIAYANKLRQFAIWYFKGSATSARRMIDGEN